MSWYDVLGVSPKAEQTEVRQAFVRLARLYHPDHQTGADDAWRVESERRMRELNDAWAVLGDQERRRAYNRSLELQAAAAHMDARAAEGGRSTRTTTAPAPRDWRSYASPGPALDRPLSEQLLTMLPMLFLALSVVLGGAGMVLRVRAFAALAVVSVGLAAVAFVVVPLMAMGDSSRRRRRQSAARRRA